jgi:hypothetical protein
MGGSSLDNPCGLDNLASIDDHTWQLKLRVGLIHSVNVAVIMIVGWVRTKFNRAWIDQLLFGHHRTNLRTAPGLQTNL